MKVFFLDLFVIDLIEWASYNFNLLFFCIKFNLLNSVFSEFQLKVFIGF